MNRWLVISELETAETISFPFDKVITKKEVEKKARSDHQMLAYLTADGLPKAFIPGVKAYIDVKTAINSGHPIPFYHATGIPNDVVTTLSALESLAISAEDVQKRLSNVQISEIPAMKQPKDATKVGKVEVATAFTEPKSGVPGLSEASEKLYEDSKEAPESEEKSGSEEQKNAETAEH